jgi:hypothetical protein
MFTIEQHIEHKAAKRSRNAYFRPGMPLANRRDVKRKFTYKEFTLVLGIFVALIVAVTLWLNRGGNEHSNNILPTSEIIIPSIHSIVKIVASVRF